MASDISFKDLLQFIVDERGVDLRGYKPTSLQRRLHKRMGQVKAAGYAQYQQMLRQRPDEVAQLLNTVLINVTDFFRDPAAWEFLREAVLPRVLSQFHPGDSVRAWTAGCASGQEAYSLAICLAEYFGDRLAEFDVKVYATDIDEEALTYARRGEYAVDQLKRLSPEVLERYFSDTGDPEVLRVDRELRGMVTFGKSDAIHDAPISRIAVLLCRNMLIYFDSATQLHVLKRFHYALQPNGILFLGKAESLLLHPDLFTPLHAKWRIFKKVHPKDGHLHAPLNLRPARPTKNRAREELMILKEYYQSILETAGQSIVVLDDGGKINSANLATTKIWQLETPLTEGTKVLESPLVKSCPELIRKVEDAQQRRTTVSFDCKVARDAGEVVLALRLRPIFSENGGHAGTIIYAEDVTPREHLQTTVAELENTSKELQSANEELETTNEELQSTNEELETMNEALQSTNEELETTNEELQSLNEELETMNEELQVRTGEMDQLNARYVQTLERMPFPVMLFNEHMKIEFWNIRAQKLFGFKAKPAVQLDLEQLPISESARRLFKRKHQTALEKRGSTQAKGESLGVHGYDNANIQFTCVEQGQAKNVLVMIERSAGPSRDGASSRAKAAKKTVKKKSLTKKKTAKRR
jgi:two-component system, chemotaxis family, CheB/CheR fusion protein